MAASVRINNLQIVSRALQQVEPEVGRGISVELHSIGQLVANDAQNLAATRIRRMSSSPTWALMRVGRTPSLVYVVPRNKGTRRRLPKSRPNFSPLMLGRAMKPALARNRPEVDRRFGVVVSTVCGRFNGGRIG